MYEIIVKLPVNGFYLEGDLALPVKAKSMVLFSGSSCRFNPHCRKVARYLQKAGYGTLLFDLLNLGERQTPERKTDLALLTRRLLSFTLWVRSHATYHELELAYFGFNLGGAVALLAAGELKEAVKAVAVESPRTDLIKRRLGTVITPVLLIAGELDFQSVARNRSAAKKLHGDKQVVIIPGASHALEEPGKTEAAAQDAASWFSRYLPGSDHIAGDGDEDFDIRYMESEFD